MLPSAKDLTYEFHTELNPQIWINKTLKPEIKDKLLEIAEAFLEFIDVDVDIEDITLTGSLANYNYTKYSDFDLHIITDYDTYNADKELLKDYFNAKKTVWNTTRDITIKGYDVELYVQDMSEPHYSTGVYSLKNNEWITEPKPTKEKANIDVEQVNKKKQAMLDMINFALTPDCDVECAEKAKEKFLNFRKVGLEKGGEFSPENLAFKELRRSGDVERLVKGVLAKKDQELSLDSVQKEMVDTFKNFLKMSTKRGPHHRKMGSWDRRLTDPNRKSISVVAQMHKLGDDIDVIHRKKEQHNSITPISNAKAEEIINRYNLDRSKLPRKLSTSNIEIGFNSQTNSYYLRKY